MTTSMNETRLNQLIGQAIIDFGATFNAALIVLGDQLGLYRALADSGPLTPAELAARTHAAERYVREWLNAQAASGYITYQPETQRYSLAPEQALLFAGEHSPVFFIGAFQSALAATRIAPKLETAFRTGEGIGWHEHDHSLFHGTERFFRSGYAANLTSGWIPALDGVEAKLLAGAQVADIGCGHGASTILMAHVYPRSTFTGFDYHADSIMAARSRAAAADLDGQVRFEPAAAHVYPGSNYDLVTSFDALHDMGDPAGVAAHVLSTLAPDGAWMIVEPYAGDNLEDNFNPVGHSFYAASTLLCTPNALSQAGGLALGAQASEAQPREVIAHGGFTRFRLAVQTPFNRVFEARP